MRVRGLRLEAVTSAWSLLIPIVGALATFLFTRGTAVRRSRSAALEHLYIAEKAGTIFGEGDPLTDQAMAAARTALRAHLRSMQRRTRAPIEWWGRAAFAVVAISGAAVAVVGLGDDASQWSLVVAGACSGLAAALAGLGATTWLERRETAALVSGVDRPIR